MFHELFQCGGLSFDRLHTFCLVAQAGSMTRAAGGDPARQSLFSRQIKELEEFFGVELVRRTGRGITLTPAGERLHRLAREHLTALTDFKMECSQRPVELSIGAGDSLIQWLLLPRLQSIGRSLPNVNLKFLNLPTAEIVQRLDAGRIDLGLVRKSAVGRSLKSASLGTLDYSLFIPEKLSRAKTAGCDQTRVLDGLPLATLEGEGSFRQELTSAARKLKIRLNIQLECSSFPLVARVLHTGKAAAILPGIAEVEFGNATVKAISLDFLSCFDREICLAWNPRIARIREVVDKAARLFPTLMGLEQG